jgi:hypothetical protein
MYQFFHALDHNTILILGVISAKSTIGMSYSLGKGIYLFTLILGVTFLKFHKQRPSSGYNLIKDTLLMFLALGMIALYIS